MGDLKPCPFCGGPRQPTTGGTLRGTAEEMQTAHDVWSWTVHHHCGATGPDEGTEAEAIAAWNRRATQPEVAALVEALRWMNRHRRAPHERRVQVINGAIAEWEAAQK